MNTFYPLFLPNHKKRALEIQYSPPHTPPTHPSRPTKNKTKQKPWVSAMASSAEREHSVFYLTSSCSQLSGLELVSSWTAAHTSAQSSYWRASSLERRSWRPASSPAHDFTRRTHRAASICSADEPQSLNFWNNESELSLTTSLHFSKRERKYLEKVRGFKKLQRTVPGSHCVSTSQGAQYRWRTVYLLIGGPPSRLVMDVINL